MRKAAVSAALLSLLCVSAHAGPMKQGLWEMTIKSDQMANAMANITPQQREMMRQRGIEIPQAAAGGMVTKMCVSKEMAERDSPPPMGREGADCKLANQQHSGSTYTYETVCNGPNMQGQGTSKVTYAGDGFAAVSDFKGTAHGRPINTHSETSGKYLGTDCGAVKPYPMPK